MCRSHISQSEPLPDLSELRSLGQTRCTKPGKVTSRTAALASIRPKTTPGGFDGRLEAKPSIRPRSGAPIPRNISPKRQVGSGVRGASLAAEALGLLRRY